MIVRQFLLWSRTAPAASRADAASALARAFLYSQLSPEDRAAAEVALTSLLDDPSPLVRRSLAEALASAADAPHHIVSALANDQSGISALVLGRSPVLSDEELVDCAAVGDAYAQAAIALRPGLKAPVAAALAEVGQREALIALAVNTGADIPEFSMRRMVERFGEDGELREALLSRAGLPAALRLDLASATARALTAFATSCNWMVPERAERMLRESREKAALTIAATSPQEGPQALVRHLRRSGVLTAGFALRCLLSGNHLLFEAIVTDLSGLPARRVSGFAADPFGSGFVALYQKAGLPPPLLPAFQAALTAAQEFGFATSVAASARLSRQMIERVLTACADINRPELHRLIALLRRYDAEAALEDAQEAASAMTAQALGPPVEFAPLLLEDHAEAVEMPVVEVELLEASDATAENAEDFSDLTPDPEPIEPLRLAA